LLPPFFFAVGREFCRIVLEDFFDVEFFGEEHVPQRGPCILAANHCSFLDPPSAVIGGIRNTFSFARKTLFRRGLQGKIFTRFLTIPVDRDGGNDISAIRTVLQVLQKGQSVLIFPEGTRSADGQIQPFKRGIGMLASRARVPIVPTRILGSHAAWNRDAPRPEPFTPIRVFYGPALSPDDYDPGTSSPDRYEIVARRIYEAICALPRKKNAPGLSHEQVANFHEKNIDEST
jgi:1-acyl-sn-glycerol-3-phosphate acyltransferase